jgi:MFS family permease
MSPLRRLLVSHALAAVAMSLPWPLLLVLVHDRVGGTPGGDVALGLTGAARMLPYVALSWVTGTLADRFRRHRILRATLVGRLALLTAVGVALSQDRLLLAVLAAAAGVGAGTPAYPALAAAIPAIAGDSRRRATDLLVTIEVASFVVGPAVGGLLLAPATRAYLPAVAAAGTGVALLLLTRVELPVPSAASGQRSTARSVLRTARRSAGVPRAIGTVALLNGVLAAVGLTLLPLASGTWGTGGFGLATAVLGFGALAAPALWWCGTTAVARTRTGLLLLVTALAAVTSSGHVGWALPGLALVGAAAVHVESAVTEQIQDAVPDEHRAGTLGLTDSVMVGAALVGSLLAPTLVSALGPRGLLVLLAVACAATAAVPARVSARQEPRIPSQREPARPPARSSSAAAPRG